jgi:hypothetical protein
VEKGAKTSVLPGAYTRGLVAVDDGALSGCSDVLIVTSLLFGVTLREARDAERGGARVERGGS